MITLECVIRSVDEKNSRTVNVSIEEKRGESWSRKEGFDVSTGTKEATRKILLAENERVVVTELMEPQVGFDREQMAAKPTQVLKADKTSDASRDDSGLPKSQHELPVEKSKPITANAENVPKPPLVATKPFTPSEGSGVGSSNTGMKSSIDAKK